MGVKMGKLIKREWKRWWKKLVKSLVFQIIFLFAFMIACLLKQKDLQIYAFRFFGKPMQITAFSGYTSWEGMENMAYYLLFVMMFLNILVIWNACVRTLHIVYMDEKNQTVYSMCNQMYSRQKLALSKYLWAQISTLFSYLILSSALWGAICIGNHIWKQETDFKMLQLQTARVMLFMIMMVSLTFLYAVWTKSINDTKYGYVSFLVFGTFFIGNLYKFRDILFWAMRKAGVTISGIKELTLWMDRGYWISPLSWLNPEKSFSVQLVIVCITVSIVAFLLGLLGYRRRNL